jgi:hypothetical protein
MRIAGQSAQGISPDQVPGVWSPILAGPAAGAAAPGPAADVPAGACAPAQPTSKAGRINEAVKYLRIRDHLQAAPTADG